MFWGQPHSFSECHGQLLYWFAGLTDWMSFIALWCQSWWYALRWSEAPRVGSTQSAARLTPGGGGRATMARIMIKLSVLFEFLLPLRSCWSSSEQDIDQIVFGSHKTIRSRRMYGGEKANRKSATKFAEGPFWTDLKATIAGYRFLNFFFPLSFFLLKRCMHGWSAVLRSEFRGTDMSY